MCGPDAGEAMGFGFDHRAEGVRAEGALMLEVDVGQGFTKSS